MKTSGARRGGERPMSVPVRHRPAISGAEAKSAGQSAQISWRGARNEKESNDVAKLNHRELIKCFLEARGVLKKREFKHDGALERAVNL